MVVVEFTGIRSKLYRECLSEFPHAWDEEVRVIKKYLAHRKSEVVLEVGAGSGFFSRVLAGSVKRLVVFDPSEEQLQAVKTLEWAMLN
ncbi:hypothetical protein AUJ65_03760 [Candidatus Micrarchaeota archaeon CG1_02_51_15]|nr:MAG: hypothetical protein AUJ65_03760 [Candidatus Micrarchaeota archaeon CG1_02_51_15]